jgi:hypothetical protein
MPIGEIAALPAAVLALLQDEAEEAAKAARHLADWLNGAIALRYADRATAARRAEGKDTGTVRLEDGEVTVIADLPKKVDWAAGRPHRKAGQALPSAPGHPRRRPPDPEHGRTPPYALRIITADERLSAAEQQDLARHLRPARRRQDHAAQDAARRQDRLPRSRGRHEVGAGLARRQHPGAQLRRFPRPRRADRRRRSGQPRRVLVQRPHFQHVRSAHTRQRHRGVPRHEAIVFVDSITDLTRQAMAYAKQQPEAFSERTGKPDVRGAYGLLGREVIQALKHLQHAPARR